jgi:uncharacterized LabA/DUF88 family protein
MTNSHVEPEQAALTHTAEAPTQMHADTPVAPAGVAAEQMQDGDMTPVPWSGEHAEAGQELVAALPDSTVVDIDVPSIMAADAGVAEAGEAPTQADQAAAPSPRRSRSRSKATPRGPASSDQDGTLLAVKATMPTKSSRSRSKRAAAQEASAAPEAVVAVPEDAVPAPVASGPAWRAQEAADAKSSVASTEANVVTPAAMEAAAVGTSEDGGQVVTRDAAEIPPVDLHADASAGTEVPTRLEGRAEGVQPADETAITTEAMPNVATALTPTAAPRSRRFRSRARQATPPQPTNLEAWSWETANQPGLAEASASEGAAQEPANAGMAIAVPEAAERSGVVDEAKMGANQTIPIADEVDPIAWALAPSDVAAPIEGSEAIASELAPTEEALADPYDGIDLLPGAPGGDLEGTEALARALLDLFPPDNRQDEAEAEAGGELEGLGSDQLPDFFSDLADDLELDESDEAIAAEAAGADEVTEAARRRGRRGRRGGRGRRRGANGASIQEETKSEAAEQIGPELQNGLDTARSAAAEAPTPGRPEPAIDVFTPESLERQDKPWRERGARRRWGKPFGTVNRDLAPVTMPPPKPSNGARFAPIPQAVQPRPFVAPMPDVAAHSPVAQLANLRIDEPLAPGETRTERLLETQTRLLQTMIEQQARQIELLTASVANLHKAMDGMVNTGISTSVTTYQPRTGIFVDAPNVCYAAENARVNLDFGRMLKYLSKDRQLVHALSYSPIIDDVREGIRYETQRFVAPFLRTGYKLVTKPLKRFSDGSAKGNFDIELALDILTMAERLDIVVLVSGDSDFESVIEHIQSRGVRVEVVAFASNVSTELVNVADSFIDINQHLEHFKAL